jgi:hypothetical protein
MRVDKHGYRDRGIDEQHVQQPRAEDGITSYSHKKGRGSALHHPGLHVAIE